MKIRIRPCPFCGGDAIVVKIKYCAPEAVVVTPFMIVCPECGCGTDKSAVSIDDALKVWNRRFYDEE